MRNLQDKGNSGFTVVEMLAAVAVIVILLGVSAVSVVKYRDLLKLTELDNAAREIYMAAENRAVLLSGARRLSGQVEEESRAVTLAGRSDGEKLYYMPKADMTEDLLTMGSIDPALWEGDFYIVYDSGSGSVTDVFYTEEPMKTLMSSGFDQFYDEWAKSRSERLKQKDRMLVGWYNGQAAQGEDSGPNVPKEPVVRVIIENGEELTVRVEYEAPAPAALSVKLGNADLTESTVLLNGNISVPAGTGSYTWVLDSLTGEKFKDLEGLKKGDGSYIAAPGDDFTVEAAITPQDGASFEEASGRDTNNSLFQAGSGGEIAYVSNLRHLQNLDSAFSGVSGNKASAIQTDDIQCRDNETYPDYDFTPIFNGALISYDGRSKEIRGLYVSGTKLTGNEAHAGLFSRTMGGTSAKPVTFKNICLVNASVTAPAGKNAGVLVGSTSDATIQSCWVYWEPDGDMTGLKDVLGSDVNGADHYQYQVNGDRAGGLVGYSKGNCTITNSLAATLVSGKNCAGGLIGGFEGSVVVIKNSYADCYLTGKEKAAGLIGDLREGRAELRNCYAAGYIMGGTSAAGLCLGSGTTTTENVYSAMRYPGRNIENTFKFLTENQERDNFTNTHFLGKDSQEVGEIKSTPYTEMTLEEFCTEMGAAFGWKKSDSHPYNLREHLFLNAYSFPGLAKLPHYGDWGAEFKEPSLVYYEQYSDDTWGVSGGNARDLVNSLEDKKSILSDGYAVAFLLGDLKTDFVVVKYTYLDKVGAEQTESKTYSKNQLTQTKWKNDDGSEADYYMIPLPAELVNSGYAQDCFYRYLKFELNLGGEGEPPSGEYFYNPHFAETVVPVIAQGGTEGGWTQDRVEEYAQSLAADMNGTREVKLRTPRHLYGLSQFKEYYTRRTVFHQILDLDYSSYTGYGGLVQAKDGKPFAQQPIGKWDEAFAGTYDGGCQYIKNVVFKADDLTGRRYAGLFGYSTGTLRNIVYEMDPEYQVAVYLGSAAENLYVGAVVGGNAGTVYNCAVSGANLRAGASGVNLYVGGLAGQNRGVIRGCAAEFARLSANCFGFASVYIGGLVGENTSSRSVSTSYAVGRIDIEADSTIKTARICGFVGWNSGSISNSYAAVDLQSSGDNVEAYGFCGVRDGSQSGTAYLDHGNFSYRESAYAANYHREDDRAKANTYTELTAREKAGSLGMGWIWQGEKPNPEKEFPYPAVVKDRDGKYIHYGQWPAPMPLGEMGVFYWEKLVDAEGGGNPTYHMSALAVDPKKNTITKQSTLSEVHNDGRVVADYGYGYYYEGTDKSSVTLETENIGNTPYMLWKHRDNNSYLDFTNFNKLDPDKNREFYSDDPANELQAIKEGEAASRARETAAEKGLSDLIGGYTFRCWNTYREAPRAASENGDIYRAKQTVSGLCLYRTDKDKSLDPNSGVFRLKQGTLQVEFIVNPQFADAMSVKAAGGLTVTGGASGKAPGETKENPYQVRSGLQLQDINWYDTAYTDVPVGLGNYKVTRFPYLNKSYYWKQTHDIDWDGERKSYNPYENGGNDNKNGVFFPIAQGFARDGDMSMSGWFQGTYDGSSYTLKNFNIGINEKNYQINTMGLFGFAKKATLTSIVMFSESGEDVVTVKGRSKDENAGDADVKLANDAYAWYAGGVLAGVALDSNITNCAVAGYTIRDETTYARNSGDMGGAIGGLVGMTNGEMKGCTASTTIVIACDHSKGGSNAPVRVGGLVGSTTASVTNCYTGGEIKVTAKNASIYAGRLIGGLGMGPFGGEDGSTNAVVSNCYSYLTLPNEGGVVKAVYSIGGQGRTNGSGAVTLTNNYYYGVPGTGGGTSVTYRQLAGQDPIDGQSIYGLLNAGQTPSPYNPVTSEVGGIAMAGRFSYAPQDRKDLQGLDYPFPTVLTQTRVSDGMVFNVHYGEWELNGIERADGNRPIELDMFTMPANGTGEELILSSNVSPGGTWSAETSGDGVVEAKVEVKNGKPTLTVTALKANDTPVTVTVKYTEPGGTEHSLPITVYVTENVELRPGTVRIFPNDTVSVGMTPYGVIPGTKTEQELDQVDLRVTAAAISEPVTAEVTSDTLPGVRLTWTGGEAAESQLWADVTYTCGRSGDPGSPRERSHRIAVNLLDLPKGEWDGAGRSWSISFQEYEPAGLALVDPAPEGAGYTVGISEDKFGIVLTRLEDAEITEDIELRVTMTIDGLSHELLIVVPPISGGTEETAP